MQPSNFRYVNNCLAGRRSTIDELGESLDENESDRDQMMRLSSYYDDRLLEVERYKAKFKENKQLMNNARKNKQSFG
ncbi:GRIP domain-containing protein RUD3-like [Pyrus ussuriensis x Pyrus communis]|uniref:GRIP domain-containing protein RUD3-like n=1 Tax=Pyrus ussuriensis x Pyrus communis TaxID=2448454 RepID=A0A5N5G993_9ROSA|nr:GRIP domain-containing protein RUD3-like [Pyrus ussuriensis x Pyrus communis]